MGTQGDTAVDYPEYGAGYLRHEKRIAKMMAIEDLEDAPAISTWSYLSIYHAAAGEQTMAKRPRHQIHLPVHLRPERPPP